MYNNPVVVVDSNSHMEDKFFFLTQSHVLVLQKIKHGVRILYSHDVGPARFDLAVDCS